MSSPNRIFLVGTAAVVGVPALLTSPCLRIAPGGFCSSETDVLISFGATPHLPSSKPSSAALSSSLPCGTSASCSSFLLPPALLVSPWQRLISLMIVPPMRDIFRGTGKTATSSCPVLFVSTSGCVRRLSPASIVRSSLVRASRTWNGAGSSGSLEAREIVRGR